MNQKSSLNIFERTFWTAFSLTSFLLVMSVRIDRFREKHFNHFHRVELFKGLPEPRKIDADQNSSFEDNSLGFSRDASQMMLLMDESKYSCIGYPFVSRGWDLNWSFISTAPLDDHKPIVYSPPEYYAVLVKDKEYTDAAKRKLVDYYL